MNAAPRLCALASVVACLAGCATETTGTGGAAPIPPKVDETTVGGLSVSEGPWGTRIAVAGTKLEGKVRDVAIGKAHLRRTMHYDVTADAISFSVPYPEEGEVTVDIGQGPVVVGRFTSTWERTTPKAMDVRFIHDDAFLSFADGKVTAFLETGIGPSGLVTSGLVTFFEGGLEAETTPLPAGVVGARLFRAADGSPALVGLDEERHLVELDGAATIVATDSEPREGFITAVSDVTGSRHVWMMRACELDLFEKSAGGWIAPRAGIVAKAGCNRTLWAETADGTLHGIFAQNDTNFLGNETGKAFGLVLEPGASKLPLPASLSGALNDAIVEAHVLVGRSGSALTVYCNDDTYPDEGSPSLCVFLERTAAGYTSLVPSENLPLGTRAAWSGDDVYLAKPDEERVVLFQAPSGKRETIMAGDQLGAKILAFTMDPSGAPVLLVEGTDGVSAVRPKRR